MRLEDSVVLVTGASAGIGRASAERLAGMGARLIVHGRDERRTAQAARATRGTPLCADLAVSSEVDALVDEALGVHGRIDVVVANAALGWSGRFTEMPVDEIDRLVALDLVAPLRLVRRLLPPMLARGAGHVVLVGSVAGRTGVAGEAVYAAAKAGLDAFAESLRLELWGSGVGVSLIVPGVVDTGFFRARRRSYDRRFPRPLAADEVARAVVDAVTRGRPEVWRPRWLRLAPAVRVLVPGPYRRLSARFGEQVRSSAPGPDTRR